MSNPSDDIFAKATEERMMRNMDLSYTQGGRFFKGMIQLVQLLVVKSPQGLLVRAELVKLPAKFLRRSCGPMILQGGSNAAWSHETVGEE